MRTLNEFRIEQSSLIQALEQYREMETVLEEERENLQNIISQESSKWQGEAAEAAVSSMNYFLQTGEYNEAYECVRKVRMCMEDTLDQVSALLVRCEDFPKQLESDTYIESMRPACGDYTLRNGGVLYLDYGKAMIIPDLCDQISEAAEYLGTVLKQSMEDCRGIIDDIDEYQNRVDAAVRKVKRVENYKLSFQKYVQGIKALENDVAVCLAGMKDESRSSLNCGIVTREMPEVIKGKHNLIYGLESTAQLNICTNIEDFEKLLSEYMGGNTSLTYEDMCGYLLYLKDNYYICEADYICLTNSLYSLTHVPSSVVEQIKKQMLKLLSERKDISDSFREELENARDSISVDNSQAILEYYFLTQFTDEVFAGTITIEELRAAVEKRAEMEPDILEHISNLYADNPEDCKQFVSDIADSYKTLVMYVNHDVLEMLGWDTEYVKTVLGENFIVDLRLAMFKSGITDEMSIKCFLATISEESGCGKYLVENNFGEEDYFDEQSYDESKRGTGLIQLTDAAQEEYIKLLDCEDEIRASGLTPVEYIAKYYPIDSATWYWGEYCRCLMDGKSVTINDYVEGHESCDGEILFLATQYYVNGSRFKLEVLEIMCNDNDTVKIVWANELDEEGNDISGWRVDYQGIIAATPNAWERRLEYYRKLERII